MLPRVGELNETDEAGFAAAMALLFERAPRFAGRLAAGRPYGSHDQLFERAEQVALAMPEREQIELLESHPRIGAAPATVSALSYREQGYDRPAASDAEVAARLERLNEAYERGFGFRFVIFVAGRPRSEIADLIEQHLAAERDAELRRGLRDVIAIARDRATRLGWPNTAEEGR